MPAAKIDLDLSLGSNDTSLNKVGSPLWHMRKDLNSRNLLAKLIVV